MKIKIWRGQNQIGGSIIEVASDTTRVILDIGSNLDEKDSVEVPQIDGLFQGKKALMPLLFRIIIPTMLVYSLPLFRVFRCIWGKSLIRCFKHFRLI